VASDPTEVFRLKEDEEIDQEIEHLIASVFKRFHYDFSQYTRASLRRRLEQACIKFRCESGIRELQQKILEEKDFFPKLLAYLTVNTTEMFRDPTYFLALKNNVFPYLRTWPSVKLWVAGCSTGEEVYTISILLKESGLTKYLLYATDINPMNLETARRGIYDADSIKKASQQYKLSGGTGSLSDYYHAAYDSVKMDKELLKNVVFSDHSLATDEVFSEMHFISCRNVLIYFERSLQDRALKLFEDSLVRDGFLGLGSKESIQFSGSKNSFTVIDRENRIFQKKDSLAPGS
jgi:chemotaxis protein methyltransferase CheR